MVHKLAERADRLGLMLVEVPNAQGRGGLPEMAPAPGQDARPHGLLCWQELEHVVQERVWQRADVVFFHLRTCAFVHLSPQPWRHFVEQRSCGKRNGEEAQI